MSQEYDYKPDDENHPIHYVTTNLYQGDIFATREQILRHHKIQAIVNAANYASLPDPTTIAKLNIDMLSVQVVDMDHHKNKIYAEFDKVADFIDSHIKNGRNVLVHCAAGVSRSSTLTLCYLVKHKKMPLAEAFELLVSTRKIASPNDGFWQVLSTWEIEQLGSLPNFTPSQIPKQINWF